MFVIWFFEIEEILKNSVKVGGGKEVFAARDEADILCVIVHDDGEVVGSADVFTGENDVAEERGIDGDGSVKTVVKSEFLAHFSGVEPPSWFALLHFPGNVSGTYVTASSRVEGAFGALGRICEFGAFSFDFFSGAEAGIDHPLRFQDFKSIGVVRKPFPLSPRFLLPVDAEPLQVFFDGVVKFFAHAGVIDVFESQEELTAVFLCALKSHLGRENVTEVEVAGGAGGKSSDHGSTKKELARSSELVYGSGVHEQAAKGGDYRSGPGRAALRGHDFGKSRL